MLTRPKLARKVTVISDYLRTVVFQAFHPIPGETGAYILTFCIHCFADRFMLHLLTFLFCFHFVIKQQQKLSSFFMLKKMAVEPEKHEDRLDEDGCEAGELRNLFDDVCFQGFNIIIV